MYQARIHSYYFDLETDQQRYLLIYLNYISSRYTNIHDKESAVLCLKIYYTSINDSKWNLWALFIYKA